MPAIVIPIVSGSPNTATADVSAGQTYFELYATAAVTLHFSFGNEEPHAKNVYLTVKQDATGRTVTPGTEFLTSGTITSTANKATVSHFFYDEVMGGWFVMGQSSTS